MAIGDYTRERLRDVELENTRLKELNREMLEALEWLLNLRSGRAKGGDDFVASAQWDDAWDSAIKVLAKAEGV